MRVIGVQMNIDWEDAAANRAKVTDMLDAAELRGGELIVLPEMFASGFTMNVAAAIDRDASTQQFLQHLATRSHVTIVAGVVSQNANGRGRNEAVVIGPTTKEAT